MTAREAASPARLIQRPRQPAINPARCTGCGHCVAVCEPHLLSLEVLRWKKTAVLQDAPSCTGCNACAVTCPFRAIVMRVVVAGTDASSSAGL